MQDRGVDVGHVVAVLDGVKAQVVGRAVDDAPLEPAAGHHDRESKRVVVAAVGPLGARRAAELGAQTTIVSSSSPRCLRSLISAAIGRSTSPQSLL